MEGRASTFRRVRADFQSRLRNADFVAIDTEFTGSDIAGDPNKFEGGAAVRLDKICATAESCALIRVGFTVAGRQRDADGTIPCTTYSFFAFPYAGPDVCGRERAFFCSVAALRAGVKRRVDFNKWVREGIPYVSRQEEQRLLSMQPPREKNHVDERWGLLSLWKLLCAAQLPLVVHCPLDLLLLLAAFERRPLPRHDLHAFAELIRQCTPKVYDTAYLHGVLGRCDVLGLRKSFDDAKTMFNQKRGRGQIAAMHFDVRGDALERPKGRHDDLPKDAGSCSLYTAQLFAYLRAVSPTEAHSGANKLFLYQTAHLDLDTAALVGEVSIDMFDQSRETVLVAAIDPKEGAHATKQISAQNHKFQWMDDRHVLVVIGVAGDPAVVKAADLAKKVRGVVLWMTFEDWTALKNGAAKEKAVARCTNGTHVNGTDALKAKSSAPLCAGSEVQNCNGGRGVPVGGPLWPFSIGHQFVSTTWWMSRVLALGGAAMFVLLLSRGKGQSLSMFARPVRL